MFINLVKNNIFVQNNQLYLRYEWLGMTDELTAWKNEKKTPHI